MSWKAGTGLPAPIPNQSPSAGIGFRAVSVRADPNVPGRVYATSLSFSIGPLPQFQGLFRSDDGGATLIQLRNDFVPSSIAGGLNVTVDSSTGDVFVANFMNQGKLVVFRNANFNSSEELASQVANIAVDQQHPGTIYVSLANGSILRSGDGGRTLSQYVKLPTVASLIAAGDGGVIHANQNAFATDGFAFKFDSEGSLTYGTYFGSGQTTVSAAAVTANGNLLLAGSTSAGLSLANAIQPAYGGAIDGFFAELDSMGGLVSSTYLGGTGSDKIDTLTVLPGGSILAAGVSKSPDFPTQASALGSGDTLILRFTP